METSLSFTDRNKRFPGLEGVFVALITPFNSRGKDSLDQNGTKTLLSFLFEKEVDGIFAFGSTGEGPLLEDNYEVFYEDLLSLFPTEKPLIIQTGMNTLDQTIEVSQMVERDAVADAISIMPPQFYTMSKKRLHRYYEAIFDELSQIPIFLYDIPQFTGNRLEPELLNQLADRYDNLAGIKSSSPDFSKIVDFIEIGNKKGLSVFVGKDEYIYSGLSYGADGAISGPANALPELYVEIYKRVAKKELREAVKAQSLVMDFIKSVIMDGSNISRIKEAVACRSIDICNFSKSFPQKLEEEARKKLAREMKEIVNRTAEVVKGR